MVCALIGYGYWGKIIEKYIMKSNLILKYIFCRKISNNEKMVSDLEIIMKDQAVDIVFVCTPIDTHYEICKTALLSGKHVFCEKPTTKRMYELEELIEIANRMKKILYSDYIYTVSPSVKYMKENIHCIGRVRFIQGCIEQFGNFYPNDNVYEVIGVHFMSAITFIMDMFSKNTCYKHFFKTKNPLSGIVEYSLMDGCNVVIFCSLVSSEKIRRLCFFGDKGILEFNMNTKPNIRIKKYDICNHTLCVNEEIHKNFDEKNGLKYAISKFVDVIEKKDNTENMNIAQEVMRILDQNETV